MFFIARKPGIEVIAGGVEHAAQLAIQRRANGDDVQGYLLSEPQAPEDLMKQRA